jgi:hypothetical protein
MTWAGFVRRFLLVFVLALASAFAFIALMNPFGNLTPHAFGAHVIMDTNDRFQHPAIVRSRAFDSIVIGTSSSKLLDPVWLEGAFGGRFANLGLNDGRAWEQYQLTALFLRTVPRPRTLLFGLDWVWCAADADVRRLSDRTFPAWIYDDDAWNDWLYVLNLGGLETAALQLVNRVGLIGARFPANGFDVFVPPETAYDAAKARRRIWQRGNNPIVPPIVPVTPAYVPSDAERAGWRYPALDWLDQIVVRAPADMSVVFAFMPAHVAEQPQPGSREAARESECKARIAAIAHRRAAPLIDFKIASPITTQDVNYWDGLHYRLPIARRIVEGIAKAVATGRDDPAGEWVVLAAPGRR